MTTTYTVNPSVLEQIQLAEAAGAQAKEMMTAIEAVMPWDNIVTEFKFEARDYLGNLDANLKRLNALADEAIASYPLL